jgi:hypothetical protein
MTTFMATLTKRQQMADKYLAWSIAMTRKAAKQELEGHDNSLSLKIAVASKAKALLLLG